MVESEDRANAGAEGPGEKKSRSPSWSLVATLIGGIFLLINGWLTYAVYSNKESMEVRAAAIAQQLENSNRSMAVQLDDLKRSMATQMEDLKERLDRVDDRVLFLEQNRQVSTDADRNADIAFAADERASE